MSALEDIKAALPDYAKDIKLNLSNLAAEESLTPQQLWGCFLACALTTRQPELIEGIESDARAQLSDAAFKAAQASATIMAMNNVYYRSIHLMSNKEYQNLSAKLRMTVIAGHGIDKIDFELWSFAVSAINGCGMCLDAHEAQLREGGLSAEQIQCALRIAATINSAATALDAVKYSAQDLTKAA